MNERHQVFAQLTRALSEIYFDLERASGVAKDAGLNPAGIKQDPTPLNYWRNILEEAERQRTVEALLDVAEGEYPKEESLPAARAAYQDWVKAGRPGAPLAEETQGERIDAAKSMGFIYKPSGPVTQYFGTLPEQPEESAQPEPTAGRPEGAPKPGVGGQLKPRLLFDERHGQGLWWYLPPTLDQGFYRLREIASKKFQVEFLAGKEKISAAQLAEAAAFILVMGPQGKTHLEPSEIDEIQEFVKKGGGLLVMGTYTGDWHHEANLNRLIEYFGIVFNRDVVLPASAGADDCKEQSPQYLPGAKSVVVARPVQALSSSAANRTWSALTRNVDQVLTLSSCSLYVDEAKAIPLLESEPTSVIQEPVPLGIGIHIDKCQGRGSGPAILVAASRFSKVVVAGNYKMFLNDFFDHPGSQNRRFWENILKWLTA